MVADEADAVRVVGGPADDLPEGAGRRDILLCPHRVPLSGNRLFPLPHLEVLRRADRKVPRDGGVYLLLEVEEGTVERVWNPTVDKTETAMVDSFKGQGNVVGFLVPDGCENPFL